MENERCPKWFSVVVLHFKQDTTWKMTLQSILEQNYPYIQLIFADDGSPGFDSFVVKQFIETQNRGNIVDVKVLTREQNAGTSLNLNEAYGHCSGCYITQIAADDALAAPYTLSRHAQALNELEEDMCGVCGITYYCDTHLHKTGTVGMCKQDMEYINRLHLKKLRGKLAQGCIFHLGSSAFLCEQLKRFLPLSKQYKLVEDWPLFFEMITQGKRMQFKDYPATLYRTGGISAGNAPRTSARIQFYKDHFAVMEEYIFTHLDELYFLDRGIFLVGYYIDVCFGQAKLFRQYRYRHGALMVYKIPELFIGALYLGVCKFITLGRRKYV